MKSAKESLKKRKFFTAEAAEVLKMLKLAGGGARAAHLLPHPSHPIHGPVTKDRFTVDEALLHRAKIAAVIRQAAVIAEHKIGAGRDHNFRIGTLVFVGPGHVIFVQQYAVDGHPPGLDLNMITCHADHKRAMVDRKIFKPSRVATQMERYYREHPAATHSRICRNCGAVTSSAGADCTVCRLLLNGGKP